jgi:hypothetical protein
MPLPSINQYKFTAAEDNDNLKALIIKQKSADSGDLQARSVAVTRWIRLWRAASDDNAFPAVEKSNFHIPLVLWQILHKVAKEFTAVWGEDQKIIVSPKGKTDAKRAPKVERWINWRIRTLGIVRKWYDYNVLKQIIGTSIAYVPYVVRKKEVKVAVPVTKTELVPGTDPQTGLAVKVPQETTTTDWQVKEVVSYEGPDLIPEAIEDWIVPTAGGPNIEDKDHFIRRLKLSMDEVFALKDEGKIVLTDEDIEKLFNRAETGKSEVVAGPDAGGEVRQERAAQAGEPAVPQGSEDRVILYNWFGKFREKGAKKTTKLVAFYSEDLEKVVGVLSRVDVCPDGELGFIKSELIRDPNKFWGIGVAELLESINNEMDMWHNIVTDAGTLGVAPIMLYSPASGYDPTKFKMEPGTAYPVADPAAVKVISLAGIDLSVYGAAMPQLLAMAERIIGVSEADMGRQYSGPNAPRTVGQQVMLQQGSSERQGLDLELERDVVRKFLNRIWELDKRFLPKPYVFRLTEENMDSEMAVDDFEGDWDFDISPPTRVSNSAQETQNLLQAYAMLANDPMIMQAPAVKVAMQRKVLSRLHQEEIAALLPDPEKMAPPQTPETETVRLMQGETIHPHPGENMPEHLAIHGDWLQRWEGWERQAPGISTVFNMHGVIARTRAHVAETEQAMKTQGGSIRVMPQGPTGMGGIPGTMPPMPGMGGPPMGAPPMQSPAAPQAGPAQAGLASLLNSGGANIA